MIAVGNTLNSFIGVFHRVISLSHVYRPILHPFSDSGHPDIGTYPGIALLGANVNDRQGRGATVLEKKPPPSITIKAPEPVKSLLETHFQPPLAPLTDEIARAAFARRAQREISELLATEGYFKPIIKVRPAPPHNVPSLEVNPGPERWWPSFISNSRVTWRLKSRGVLPGLKSCVGPGHWRLVSRFVRLRGKKPKRYCYPASRAKNIPQQRSRKAGRKSMPTHSRPVYG